MDEELDKIVQEMINNNESDTNIQGVIDSYNSKKKSSSILPSTSILSNVASNGRTVSSGTSKNKGFPKIDTNSVAPGMGVQPKPETALEKEKRLSKKLATIKVTPANMEEVSADTDELRKIQKQKEVEKRNKVKVLEQNFYSNIKPKEIDALAEKESDDVINNKGFFNTVEDYARTGYNKVVDALSQTSPTAIGLQSLKVNKDATIEHRQKVIDDAKKNKENLSEQEIQNRTRNSIVSEKKQAIYDDRVNSYLDDLPEDEKNILYQDRASKSTHLNDENKKLNKVLNARKALLETKVSDYKDLESELLNLKNSGLEIPKDKYEAYLSSQNDIKSLAKSFESTSEKLQKNKSDLGTVEQELDMFKRDYGDISGMIQKTGLQAIDLGAGFIGGLDYLATLGGTFDEKGYKKTLEDVSKIQDYTSKQRKFIRKPISEVKSPEGFMNYVSDVISNQAPILATTVVGGEAGLLAMGASSTGQKASEMNKEVQSSKANYKPWQTALVPLLWGASEVVSEKMNLDVLKKSGRVLSAISENAPELIRKSASEKANEFVSSVGKGFLKEQGGEHFTNFFQNGLNKFALAKKNVSMLDGVGDTFKDTAVLNGLIGFAPQLAGAVLKEHASRSDMSTLDENSKKLITYSKQLNNPELSVTEKQVLEKQIGKINNESSEILKKNIKNINDMPVKLYDEVISINKQAGDLKLQAEEIKKGSLPKSEKEVLLNSLKEDYKAVQNKRNGIIDGTTTVVDVLPLKEQDKLKRAALQELTAEQNPDGSKNITIDDQQITERANKNYLKQQENESNQDTSIAETGTKTEVQEPQAEAKNTEQEVVAENLPETENIEKIEDVSEPIHKAVGSKGIYFLDGEKGEVKFDGQTVVFETDDKIIELGNKDELSNYKLSDFNINKEEELDISLNEDNSFDVRGKKYFNNYSNPDSAISQDKEGNYTVTLDTENGQKRTFRGQQAEQMVYQTKLKNFEQNGSEQQIEKGHELADEIIRTKGEVTETPIKRENKSVGKVKPKVVEKVQESNTVTDGSIRPDTNGVVETGISEQKNPATKSVSKTVDVGKNKGDSKVKANDENGKTESTSLQERNGKESDEDSEKIKVLKEMWNQDPIPSGETNKYDSGNTIDREHGPLRNEQSYEVQKDLARVQVGLRAISHAKEVFGSEYVEKTLSFINESDLSPEKKATAYVLLENEMDARVKANPKNVGEQKLQDLVRAKSQEFLANSARAIGAGRFRVERFRELVKNGFSEEDFTNAVLTSQQIRDKEKIQKISQVTPEDVNKESDTQESSIVDADLEKLISEGVEKQINEIYKKLPTNRRIKADKAISALENIQKKLRGKAYDATIGVPIAIIDSGITIIKNSIKAGVNIADAIELGINHIKSKYGKDWNKEDDFRKDMKSGFENEGVAVKERTVKEKTKEQEAKDLVKQSLIEAGFGREITVKTANGKEKRQVLDWKKLAGEEGSVEKIRRNVEEVLKTKDYSKKDIKEMKNSLEKEYVRLSSDVIEKGLNELENRNTPRKPNEIKSAAKRLAELNNYGLFEDNKDSYEHIINNVLGLNELDQKAFEGMKEIAKGYSVLLNSGYSEIAMKGAINELSRKQARLLSNASFLQSSKRFKIITALAEMTNLSTRFKLVNLGNLNENISSGIMARAYNDITDLFINKLKNEKTTNKELKQQSSKNAKSKLKGIVLEAAESYGDTSSLLLSHSKVEDYFNESTTNKAWHALLSSYMGRPVLEGADSFNKILLTEAKMVRSAILILEKKGMTNKEALDYVSTALTGESMDDAKVKAKELIESVNEKSGKKILNDSKTSIESLASDIVKDALVSGGQMTQKELEAVYNAAYKSAGRDIGHVSNNRITDEISFTNSRIEEKISSAIKEKDWRTAAYYTGQQIIWRNFIYTFVGGGTNWFVKGLQKAGNPLSLISLNDDIRLKAGKELDITTEDGIKNMEKVLYRNMNLRSTAGTIAIGTLNALLMFAAFKSTGADDDLDEWLKKNAWAKKFFDKMAPDVIVAMLAFKNKEMGRYYSKMINQKPDFFDDQKNIQKVLDNYTKGFVNDDKSKVDKASGILGEMIGNRFDLPGPLKLAKDIKQVYKGAVKGEYDKQDYYKSGFWNGFLKGGVTEAWGLRPEPNTKEGAIGKPKEPESPEEEFKKQSVPKLPGK